MSQALPTPKWRVMPHLSEGSIYMNYPELLCMWNVSLLHHVFILVWTHSNLFYTLFYFNYFYSLLLNCFQVWALGILLVAS